jgi:hypothetical protein
MPETILIKRHLAVKVSKALKTSLIVSIHVIGQVLYVSVGPKVVSLSGCPLLRVVPEARN